MSLAACIVLTEPPLLPEQATSVAIPMSPTDTAETTLRMLIEI
jgi:hypothetical protein